MMEVITCTSAITMFDIHDTSSSIDCPNKRVVEAFRTWTTHNQWALNTSEAMACPTIEFKSPINHCYHLSDGLHTGCGTKITTGWGNNVVRASREPFPLVRGTGGKADINWHTRLSFFMKSSRNICYSFCCKHDWAWLKLIITHDQITWLTFQYQN